MMASAGAAFQPAGGRRLKSLSLRGLPPVRARTAAGRSAA
jgi:hypothetical protein